jgi:predicted DNA-binding transcriptional regulator AlpA
MNTEDVWYSFRDLQRLGIVRNWQTLRDWQNNPQIAFPKGVLFGPNSRRWSKQQHVDPWIASRPIEWLKSEAPSAEAADA